MCKNTLYIAALTTLALVGCDLDDDNRNPEEQIPATRTHVIFSPGTQEFPLPNDLLFGLEPDQDGTLYASAEPGNPVVTGIDYMDGNSLVAPIDIMFTAPLDETQNLDARSFVVIEGNILPNPNQNVFLLPLSYPGGDPLQPASTNGVDVEVPTFSEAASYQMAASSGDVATLSELASPTVRAELIGLDGVNNNTLRITPLKPLHAETKYLVVITNLRDYAGKPVYRSIAYDYIRDPASNFSENLPFAPVRDAIQGWTQLAGGYFSFKQQVFEAASLPVSTPEADDIILSFSFTTGGAEAVLKSIAAPETFVEKSLRTHYKQDAIEKLVSGSYSLNGDTSNLSDPTDIAINLTLTQLLTAPTLPDDSPNPLYQEQLALAISAGADYSSLAEDPAAAHLLQMAATTAAIRVHDSGSAEQGDQAPYVDIATEAYGMLAPFASGATPLSERFPVPDNRMSSFYRVDLASELNPALAAPALVYQGQINLPLYQQPPTAVDGSNIVNATWQADQTIGGLFDLALGNPEGTTPPSDKITYRFPFPKKQAMQPIPLLAVLPEPSTLASFGLSKPENGWPVIIFQHGIGADRSTILPMADALAFACVKADLSGPSGAPCFASVGIDSPVHGITPSGSAVPGLFSVGDPDQTITPNLPGEPDSELRERHYDFTADAAGQPVPMSYASDQGVSGSLLINLQNFANNRDHRRQIVLDLLNLNASLEAMDIDGDGEANDLDTSRVYLIGHSLGAIDALNFVAINNLPEVLASPFSDLPRIQAVSTMFPGGAIPRLLTNSPRFAGPILGGLAASSDELVQGRSGLEVYLSVFQGLMDSADPVVLSPLLLEQDDTAVLISEIAGSPGKPSDQAIPNAADTLWGENNGPLRAVTPSGLAIDGFPAPLVGTEPLIAGLHAEKAAEVDGSASTTAIVSRYTEGSHTTPVVAGNTTIDPLTSEAVFTEILQQTIAFFAVNGAVNGSIVSNPAVIEP